MGDHWSGDIFGNSWKVEDVSPWCNENFFEGDSLKKMCM